MRKSLVIAVASALFLAGASCSIRNNKTTTANVPSGPVRAQVTEPGVIPAGTTLVIRTNEEIKTQQAGKTYSAQVAETVENQSGQVLVPKGSPAELIVLQTSSGGTTGTASLALGVRSITVNGKTYSIATDTHEQRGGEGLGANRRTAEMVGGGAVLGTLLGAVAGGGKGAAIGAVVGAAGGAAAQVLTRGDEVKVPAETLLTFRLDQPWRMTS